MRGALYKYCKQVGKCGRNRRESDCFFKDNGVDLNDFFATFMDYNFDFGNDAIYIWEPRSYLYRSMSDENKYCLSMLEMK